MHPLLSSEHLSNALLLFLDFDYYFSIISLSLLYTQKYANHRLITYYINYFSPKFKAKIFSHLLKRKETQKLKTNI